MRIWEKDKYGINVLDGEDCLIVGKSLDKYRFFI